jgi:Cytochrome bd terminal oxidase subunit I
LPVDLDPVLLARIQFAFTIIFHIIFPTFTIGLSAYIATLCVMWMRTGRERYRQLAQFWTKIFAVSFAMGVVSGIVLSYQFGTNWSRFSIVVGNVIGPMIAYEVLVAFFLDATFLGVMLFGWNRVPPWLHTLSAITVAVGTTLSAFWILSANSWMQTPAGYEMRDGIAYPLDWLAIVFNASFPYRLAHMVTAAYLTTSFVVLAVGGTLPPRRQARGAGTHYGPHGDCFWGHRGAVAALHRRSTRPQYSQAPTDEDRGGRRALGRQRSGRSRADRLARREGGDEPLCGANSSRRLPYPHP